MELTELSLHNFKNHRRLNLTFKPGVTGIVGKNGSGKSNVIIAIAFLFTGQVDTDRKEECVTVGESEGWVRGSFILNGKVGSLERHLSTSRVVLNYDGIEYTKASEVNALWNDLLKIDSTIFNNVIIAKQGEIQKLFSDDSSIREKIFQKIFLVPPTEKLRSLIWDNYIKGCPPDKPEEDVMALQTSQAQIATNRNKLLLDIEDYTIQKVDPAFIKSVNDRIQYLEKCQKDLLKRPELVNKLDSATTLNNQQKQERNQLEEELAKYNLINIRQQYEALLANRTNSQRQKSIVTELDTLLANVLNDDEFILLKNQTQELQNQSQEYQRNTIENSAKLRELSAKIHKYEQLSGHIDCPTCGQALINADKFTEDLVKQETQLKVQTAENNKLASALGRQLQALNSKIATVEATHQRISYLTGELTNIGTIEYSEELYLQLKAQIQTIEAGQRKMNQYQLDFNQSSADIQLLNEKLANLYTYNGDTSIEEELNLMQSVVAEDVALKDTIAELELSSAKLQHELELYDQRIKTSELNAVYNGRRKQFIQQLNRVYDLFHVSCFPRKLIECYVDTVQTSLGGYLERFDLPYLVRITDGFKVVLEDSLGHTLPKISGGQEVMVGICLRLALHKMFARNFSLMVLDEGTNHLDEDKRPMYFELIDYIRNQKIINQMLIIDHDKGLLDVVDQHIEL